MTRRFLPSNDASHRVTVFDLMEVWFIEPTTRRLREAVAVVQM
jgi:hypothetical protein